VEASYVAAQALSRIYVQDILKYEESIENLRGDGVKLIYYLQEAVAIVIGARYYDSVRYSDAIISQLKTN
jgi:hypothetical protein